MERDFIIRHHQADSYKVIRFLLAVHNLVRDIRWAECAFYAGANLAQIKEEIIARHTEYKAEKKKADERLMAMQTKKDYEWDEWLDENHVI